MCTFQAQALPRTHVAFRNYSLLMEQTQSLKSSTQGSQSEFEPKTTEQAPIPPLKQGLEKTRVTSALPYTPEGPQR